MPTKQLALGLDLSSALATEKLRAIVMKISQLLPTKIPQRIYISYGWFILCTIMQDFQIVTVSVKIIKVTEPEQIASRSRITKQDVYVADTTGSMRLTLWETDINKLHLNQSYLNSKSECSELPQPQVPLLS